LIGLSGCVGSESGQKQISDPTKVSQIQKGITTKADIRTAFGDPAGMNFLENGDEEWTYSYVNMSVSPINFVPVVGIVAGDVSQKVSSLNVTFDKRGIVKAYATNNTNSSVGGKM
jgi:outer membrane protein assembly factor BamE (lipoprotein component of BamABCDE complex)